MATGGQRSNLAPLVGQPERQAIDSLLGYDYQIWRTVELWMQLGPGEVLYIECAEDFDVVTAGSATTNQVKNSPDNITLGSEEVRDAIVNHWTAVQKNPGRSVKMRFLTRGDIGSEKSKPFGQERGIEVWRKAAAGDAAANQTLTAYLQGALKDASLRQFLATSTPENRVAKLYGAIEWVVKEPVIEAVRISVRRAAIERGNARGVATHMSEKAVSALLEKCRQVATAKQPELRSLTAEDLQAVFDASTSIQVPATQVLASFLGQALSLASSGGLPLAFSPFAESGELPPLPAFVMPRADFCGRALAALTAGPVLIVGSEGMGKSIVATLAARDGGVTSHWGELPEQVERVCSALEHLLMLVRSGRGPRRIVLDDVPAALGLDGQVWTRLNALLESCHAFDAQLLMTAKGVPEDQVDSRFRSTSVQVLAVPALTEPEVESFFESLGCPPEMREIWAKSTLLQSGYGHPKLVHLRGLELRDQGWPKPTTEAFLKSPASIEEARANARQTVGKTVPEPDKSYLYTLSVAALPFSRELALKVGESLGVPTPGDTFDRLSGRWIEAKGKNLYSVTNLLSSQAQHTFSAAQVAKAHGVLFDTFVGKRSISVSEAWGIFFQAFQSLDRRRLSNFVASLVSADFKQVPGLAESLEILLSMASGNVLVGPYDAKVSAMFRHLQFKIAAHVRPEAMAEIARQWAWTIQQIEHEEARRGLGVIRGLCLAISMGGDLPPDILVQAIADAAELDKLAFTKPAVPEFDEMVKSDGTPLGYVGLLFLILQARCDGFQFVDAALKVLENIDPSLRARMLEAFDVRLNASFSMITKAWLVETKLEQPDWGGLIEVFQRASALAKLWGARALGHNVARIQSIIYEEERAVRDQERSIAVLEEAKQAFGDSAVLEEQRANIEFLRGNFPAALDLWSRSLDHGLNDPAKLRDPFAFRKGAIAASKVGHYERAATFLEAAGSMLTPEGAGPVQAAFEVDAAYCWFKHGDPVRALTAISRAAVQLKGVYDPTNEFQLFRAQKHCGSCVLWMVGQVYPDEKGASSEGPQVGAPTAPEQQELIATLSASPYPMTAVMILRAASRLGIDGPVLSELRRDADGSSIPLASIPFAGLLVEEAIVAGDFADFGERMFRWQRAWWQGMVARESGANSLLECQHPVPDEIKARPMDLQWYFALALAILTMRREDPQASLAKWDAQISAAPDSQQLLAELRITRAAFSMDLPSAFTELRASASIKSVAAAAIVLAQHARRPLDTCYAQVGLLTWFYSGKLVRRTLEAAMPHLAELFSEQWRPHLQHPAALRDPRLSIPGLNEAIAFPGTAPARLLKLVIAGSQATGQPIPQFAADALSSSNRFNAEAERLQSTARASMVESAKRPP